MGYTHYFRKKELVHDEKSFAAFIADVNKALSNLPKVSLSSGGYHADVPLVLAGGNGAGDPEITDDYIWLNGSGINDMCHETFHIERVTEFDLNESYDQYQKAEFDKKGELFAFCKTARKPYDFVVQVILILYKRHFGDKVRVSSDGDNDDWSEAFDFVRDHFALFGKIEDELEVCEQQVEGEI